MRYEIRVKGKATGDISDWFGEMQVRQVPAAASAAPDLLLSGSLPDQSALLGVLMRLHNLQMTILSVQAEKEEGG